MGCSICGKGGHNSRTCPYRDPESPRDQALWIKFDNITEGEATDLQAAIIKDKFRIAPKARGTSVKGTVSELPDRIRESLRLLGDSDGSKEE